MPVVLPSPPVAVPNGQTVIWAYAGKVVNDIGDSGTNSLVSTLTGAEFEQWESAPLGSTYANATWSQFALPPTPFPNVSIQGMYPVVVSTGIGVNNVNLSCSFTEEFPYVFVPGNFSNVETTTPTSIGNTLADLEAYTINIGMGQSTLQPSFATNILNVTFVGFAVYITTPTYRVVANINVGNTYPFPS